MTDNEKLKAIKKLIATNNTKMEKLARLLDEFNEETITFAEKWQNVSIVKQLNQLHSYYELYKNETCQRLLDNAEGKITLMRIIDNATKVCERCVRTKKSFNEYALFESKVMNGKNISELMQNSLADYKRICYGKLNKYDKQAQKVGELHLIIAKHLVLTAYNFYAQYNRDLEQGLKSIAFTS